MLPRLFNKCFIIIIVFVSNFSSVFALWENKTIENYKIKEEINFIVTGYYTPLENQKSYINWSFLAEVKMNWEWKHMASWKEVFMWAIAAPKKFTFWTKIYLEWYWVWVVEDRWWNLWNKWTPRIDIWTWVWENWMEKARKLWVKHIKWYIINDDAIININFWNNVKRLESKNTKINLDKLYICPESNIDEIKELEIIFASIWIYKWKIDWVYNSIKNDLINFQLTNWIIKSKKDEQSWYFWQRTISKIKELYPEIEKKNFLSEKEINLLQNKVEKIKNKFWDKYDEKIKIIKNEIEKIKKKNWLKENITDKLEYLESII